MVVDSARVGVVQQGHGAIGGQGLVAIAERFQRRGPARDAGSGIKGLTARSR